MVGLGRRVNDRDGFLFSFVYDFDLTFFEDDTLPKAKSGKSLADHYLFLMHSIRCSELKMKIRLSLTCFLIPTIGNFFFISFIMISPSFCDDKFRACGVSYNCGDLVDISYPFWGNKRQQFCGRREFKLNCTENRTTTIEINSLEYYVLNISQSDHRMTIARSDLLDNLCPQNQIQTAIMNYYLFVYSGYDRQMSLWYDCPLQGSNLDSYRFSCGLEGEENGRANYAFEAMQTVTIEGRCNMKIDVTVTTEGLAEGGKNRTAMLEKAVRGGFDVEYGNLYTVACEACKESGGKCGGNGTDPLYCICESQDEQPSVCRAASAPGISSILPKKILIIVAIALGGIILIISITILSYCTRKRISNKNEIDEIVRKYSTHTPQRYSYSKLKKITSSFKNKLGHGGFSVVYKGTLPDGIEVAVKLLNESKEDGQDFMNEVVSITKTSHVNVATILGFCYERNKRALIYEYMPKGSLDKYMSHAGPQQNDVELDWNTLYNIIMGVARGLEYLHRGCNTRILHFDIKPHNILLDNEFCPKISDFGLAKQCRARESQVSMTGVKGTIGFMAPEVIFRNVGKVSHKSDVYSFGMLVLEMVGERRNPSEGVGERREEYFPDWIYRDLAESEIDDGRRRWGSTEEEEEMARKMIIVGLCCIQTMPEERPSMSGVVGMLEGSVDGLRIPPRPTLFGPPALPEASSSSSSSSIS